MESDKLRTEGKKMLDFVADYWDGIRTRKPLPDVKPGYITELVSGVPLHVHFDGTVTCIMLFHLST